MSDLFQTSADVHKIETLVDGGFKLIIYTQELTAEEATKLFSLKGKQGWVLIKETPIVESDLLNIPEPDPEFKTEKSPSQRIRNCLWILWSQKYKTRYPVFDDFYRTNTEKIIIFIKSRLD